MLDCDIPPHNFRVNYIALHTFTSYIIYFYYFTISILRFIVDVVKALAIRHIVSKFDSLSSYSN